MFINSFANKTFESSLPLFVAAGLLVNVFIRQIYPRKKKGKELVHLPLSATTRRRLSDVLKGKNHLNGNKFRIVSAPITANNAFNFKTINFMAVL